MIPELFRGDGDYQEARKLKVLLKNGVIQSNLVNGGIGREIFEYSLIHHIKNHVNSNWGKTHFLSFTEDFDKAIHYGKGLNNSFKTFDDYYEEDDYWDFAILKLEAKTLKNMDVLEKGVYRVDFIPSAKEFLPLYPILIIDVVTVLENSKDDNDKKSALLKANSDHEWLILPTHMKYLRPKYEYSGLLDINLFSEINKYKFYE